MDNMEFTKITGALCGALLFYLMINWGAETLYHVESGDGGHGEAHTSVSPASIYKVELETEIIVEKSNLLDLLAAADVAKVKKHFPNVKLVTNLQTAPTELVHIYSTL